MRAERTTARACMRCSGIHQLRALWIYVRSMATTGSKRRVATAVRLPAELHTRLQEHAEMRDVSVNWLVTRAVEQFLAGLPSREQVEATLKAS